MPQPGVPTVVVSRLFVVRVIPCVLRAGCKSQCRPEETVREADGESAWHGHTAHYHQARRGPSRGRPVRGLGYAVAKDSSSDGD